MWVVGVVGLMVTVATWQSQVGDVTPHFRAARRPRAVLRIGHWLLLRDGRGRRQPIFIRSVADSGKPAAWNFLDWRCLCTSQLDKACQPARPPARQSASAAATPSDFRRRRWRIHQFCQHFVHDAADRRHLEDKISKPPEQQ